MIICSINLNKRLESLRKNIEFANWLIEKQIDILIVQEGSKKILNKEKFLDYYCIGGNNYVSIWVNENNVNDNIYIENITEKIQKMEIGYISLYNVYLDAYKKVTRKEQLEYLDKALSDEKDKPLILLGDFNIAPNKEDGLYNNEYSNFNSDVDRGALKLLISNRKLIDKVPFGDKDFTIERKYLNKTVSFRCDLALLSKYISDNIKIYYDHSVRKEKKFTDHSALILDVPVSLNSNLLINNSDIYFPHKTAISRRNPSSLAKSLVKDILPLENFEKILDYGCGYGKDVDYYNSEGLKAFGFDPHPKFNYINKPNEIFDCVSLVYVLNVLPNPYDRLKVIKKAASYLKTRGIMLIATRSEYEINKQALQKNWQKHNDGYWSSINKGTFQKGLDSKEIVMLAENAGLEVSDLTDKLKRINKNTSAVIFRKK